MILANTMYVHKLKVGSCGLTFNIASPWDFSRAVFFLGRLSALSTLVSQAVALTDKSNDSRSGLFPKREFINCSSRVHPN